MIARKVIDRVLEDLSFFPIVGIIGSRQEKNIVVCGLVHFLENELIPD